MEVNNSFIIENIVKNIIKYIIIIIFLTYITIQIITITKFIFNYNYSYNYGNKLKTECKNNNIEFETERYQLYNNILDFIITNDSNKIINYVIILLLILMFSIIFSLGVSYILYNYINDIIISDINNSTKFIFFCYIMMTLICSFTLIVIPLYIGYVFDNDNENNINNFNNNIVYAEYIFGILLIIIIITNLNTHNNLYSYKYGNIFIVSIAIAFYLCMYLIKSIIIYYKKKRLIIRYNNENIKSNYDVKKKFLKNELDLNINIYLDYFAKLFKIDSNNIDLNYYTSILIISLIVIGLVMILNRSKNFNKYIKNEIDYKELLECILYNRNICENFLYNDKESKIIYNFIILPLIFIIFIIITINSTINYNEVINTNIILHPLIIYKKEINNINNHFSNILDNDKHAYKEKKSVDRNIANSILLVLYNEIFSDMMTLSREEKQNYQEFSDIDILPKFKFIFNNKKEILDYSKIYEYNIQNYLINKCNEDIFINTNLNSKCKEKNKFILYYIIRAVFLYYPISTISGIEKSDKSKYDYYKNILKHKIYDSLINYKNARNYLGTNKLNDNNYEKNCSLKTKIKDIEITKDELIALLTDMINDESVSQYKKFFSDNVKLNLSRDEIFTQLKNLMTHPQLINSNSRIIPLLDSIKLNITPSILDDRISKLESSHNIIINNKDIIEKIVEKFIDYIIGVQTHYFIIYRGNKDETTLEVSDEDLSSKFRDENIQENEGSEFDTIDSNENTILSKPELTSKLVEMGWSVQAAEQTFAEIDRDNDTQISQKEFEESRYKINSFIKGYRNIIKTTFDEINIILSNYENENDNNDYHKPNNVTNYLLNNYYIANNNNIRTEIEKVNIDSYKNKEISDDIQAYDDDNDKIINIMMSNIIILIYYNHFFILEIKNKYNNAYLDSLFGRIESLYTNNSENKNYTELKAEYITKINELIIILNNTIYNKIEGNTEKIIKYIKESSVNNYIIDELIKFDNKYENKKIIINEIIDSIKNFDENKQEIDIESDNFNIITTEYVNDINGLENNIIFFINYIKKSNIDSSHYNIKNMEFINNIYTEQKNILEILSNTNVNKINLNKILIDYNYLNKFDEIIKDYNNFYNNYYKILTTVISKEENDNNKKIEEYNSKESSNIVYQNANNTSNMILILISIYIVVLYILIKLK